MKVVNSSFAEVSTWTQEHMPVNTGRRCEVKSAKRQKSTISTNYADISGLLEIMNIVSSGLKSWRVMKHSRSNDETDTHCSNEGLPTFQVNSFWVWPSSKVVQVIEIQLVCLQSVRPSDCSQISPVNWRTIVSWAKLQNPLPLKMRLMAQVNTSLNFQSLSDGLQCG